MESCADVLSLVVVPTQEEVLKLHHGHVQPWSIHASQYVHVFQSMNIYKFIYSNVIKLQPADDCFKKFKKKK